MLTRSGPYTTVIIRFSSRPPAFPASSSSRSFGSYGGNNNEIIQNLLQINCTKRGAKIANTSIWKKCVILNILDMLALGSDLVNDSLKYLKLLTQNKKEITAVNPSKPLSSVLVLYTLRAVQLMDGHSYFQLFCHRS